MAVVDEVRRDEKRREVKIEVERERERVKAEEAMATTAKQEIRE